MDEADVVVTHDTGPLHLAGITRTGIVTLFGPTDPHGRLPQRLGTVALWGGEGFSCRPCYDAHGFPDCPSNDCMRQLTPAMVLTEVLAMIGDRARGELRPPRVMVPPSSMPAGRLVEIR
jgi:heptosyltransferase-2